MKAGYRRIVMLLGVTVALTEGLCHPAHESGSESASSLPTHGLLDLYKEQAEAIKTAQPTGLIDQITRYGSSLRDGSKIKHEEHEEAERDRNDRLKRPRRRLPPTPCRTALATMRPGNASACPGKTRTSQEPFG